MKNKASWKTCWPPSHFRLPQGKRPSLYRLRQAGIVFSALCLLTACTGMAPPRQPPEPEIVSTETFEWVFWRHVAGLPEVLFLEIFYDDGKAPSWAVQPSLSGALFEKIYSFPDCPLEVLVRNGQVIALRPGTTPVSPTTGTCRRPIDRLTRHQQAAIIQQQRYRHLPDQLYFIRTRRHGQSVLLLDIRRLKKNEPGHYTVEIVEDLRLAWHTGTNRSYRSIRHITAVDCAQKTYRITGRIAAAGFLGEDPAIAAEQADTPALALDTTEEGRLISRLVCEPAGY